MSHKEAKHAVNAYFSELTRFDESQHADELARASQLLENASLAYIDEAIDVSDEAVLEAVEVISQPRTDEESALADASTTINAIEHKEIAESVETINIDSKLELDSLRSRLPKRFQALFFEVGGLTLAIPLVELGGIVQMQALNKLPNKPSWFMGVLLKQQETYNCVNTAQWIMPEKYTQSLADTLNYTYVIQLGKTPWALACSRLTTTVDLTFDDIKWRDQSQKRPWLAGMIKEKMCALIDPSHMIAMLQSKPINKLKNNAVTVVTE